jgi:threonylcarbamoyladenosine tRNA methylthiotransferase MtaB
MPSFKTVTLGCKVNQYETEYLREGFLRLGYREAEDEEAADVCVVNTCTVTSEGDLKSRRAIRQLARQNPGAEIIVMGCYATRAREEVSLLPGVVDVVTDKRQLPDLLARRGLVDLPKGISRFGQRHRAYVKVQDGCRMQCSYCIIPTVRPVLWSRPPHEVLDEIRRLIGHAYGEIVLTGIHLGHYGMDQVARNGDKRRTDLARLVERIMALEGNFRIRLSSLEAVEVTPELIDLAASRPERICPHFHVSMQSGSDAVLSRMRRRWPSGRFIERCLAIREALDAVALTTDVIVGFPGETDADFEATCHAVETIRFSKLHIFRFSPREGTPAAKMPEQVESRVKHQRAVHLAEIGDRLRRQYMESLVGKELQVLVETRPAEMPGTVCGTADRYVPVQLPGPERLCGRLVQVAPSRLCGERLVAG